MSGKHVSVSGATFARLQAAARDRGLTMRAILEQAIGEIPDAPPKPRRTCKHPRVAHASRRAS